MRKRIIIMGGGAPRLTAAISGARNGVHMAIVGRMDRAGKKVLFTGNGRCNLINLRMEADCYRCGRKEFLMEAIRGFRMDEASAFSKGFGIEPEDRNGYIYPNLDQASAALNVLHSEVEQLGVAVLPSCRIEKIEPAAGGGHACYKAYTDQGILDADTVILAASSKATSSTGSDGSGYELAGRLEHRVIKPLPTLVRLRCQGNPYRQMASIRAETGIKLMAAGKLLTQDRGELQLTDYDLSNILVFQVNRSAVRALNQGRGVTVLVDFMSSWDDGEAFSLFRKRASLPGHKAMEELSTGLLSKKLAPILIKLAGIKPSQESGDLSPKQLKLFLGQIKFCEAIVMPANPSANAQVCCGGVGTGEVGAATMESRFHANLYLAGELLDMDGICGGYNPQFAWFSSMIAGTRMAGGHSVGKHEAGANKAAAHGAYAPAPDRKKNRRWSVLTS